MRSDIVSREVADMCRCAKFHKKLPSQVIGRRCAILNCMAPYGVVLIKSLVANRVSVLRMNKCTKLPISLIGRQMR